MSSIVSAQNASGSASGPAPAVIPRRRAWLRAVLCGLLLAGAAEARRDRELSEDSLQALVAREPENPAHWMKLGTLAARNSQIDLAKGYFDEAIKLSGNQGKTILEVGDVWLSQGRVKASLPYLMPNLGHLDPARLDQLQNGLEKERLYSAQLLVLRNLGLRTQSFQPVNRHLAMLAFYLGDYALCEATLARFADQLDLEAARNLLLVSFFMGGAPEPKVIATLRKRFPVVEIGYLSAFNAAQSGKWGEVRDFLKREANSASYRDYYELLHAMEAAADDRSEEAAEAFEKARETAAWDRIKVVINAELYRLYSSTGNKFKSDQIWEQLKEDYQEADPELQEFMARQLAMRGYEKQSKYFYRVALRRKPGSPTALAALWDDLMANEDWESASDNLKALLERDPLSCEGNTLAMEFHQQQKNDKELLPYGRNATVYCYEALEPYLVLGNTLMNLSRPEEARSYFSTYIRKGGDVNKVPISLR
jgi:tetratricopeptide (TPR) repeat protein